MSTVQGLQGSKAVGTTDASRWSANLCHDGSPEVTVRFPESDGSKGICAEPSLLARAPGTVAYGKFNDRRMKRVTTPGLCGPLLHLES